MPNVTLARLLAALLPRAIARDVFEPAWWDLRIGHLERRARVRSPLARSALGWRHAIEALVLCFDCWRLVLADPRSLFPAPRPSAVAHTPNTERFSMLLYYLRHAFRRLVREPAFTVAAALTLALGVGANVAVFAVVEAVLLRALPYPEADNLVILNHRDQRTGITKEFIAIGDYIDMAARQSAFEAFGGYNTGEMTAFGESGPYRVAALQASDGAFAALRMRPLMGRGLTAEDGRPGAGKVVILGHELWQTRFGGDPAILNRSVRIGTQQRLIVGVAPPGFNFPPNANTDIIFPLTVPLEAPAQRTSAWVFVLARLKSDRTVEAGSSNLATIARQMSAEHPATNDGTMYFAVPLRDALVGNTKSALVLLLSAVAFVLLIACANVANLLLARSLARRKEMTLRMALGAGRGRLALQLMTESLMLAVVAGAVGIVIAQWGSQALVALVPRSVNVPGLADVRLNGLVFAFALFVTLATALVFGLISALTVRFEHAASALVVASRASMSRGARRATSGLVVTEIAFAIVLLIGAGLILRSFARLLAVDPGFRSENVMTMQIDIPFERYREVGARAALYDQSLAALRALPDVKEVGAAVVVPLTGNNWTVPFEKAEQPVAAGERPPDVGWQAASGGYFKTLQIPLVAGRLFDATDRPESKPVVIVSEALQKLYYPNESAVGRQVKLGQGQAEIVGVVGSIRRAGLRDDPRADMYFPFERNPGNQITLFIRTSSDPTRSLGSMQRALKAIEPNMVFLETETLEQVAAESVRVTKLVLWLLAIFAVTSLVLAAIGIYGVMSYVVRQRTREIGTRIALGALRKDIVWMVMRQGAGIAALGTIAGVAVGLGAARFLSSIVYGVSTSDPIVLGVAATVLVATTMAACYVPARRAASVDPAITLAEQ
jgi:putative ABC transport system permease protein